MRAAAAILLASAAALSAGCSDDDEPVRTATVEPGSTVTIEATEYRFDPGRVVFNAGGRAVLVSIVLENRGSLAHNIHVRDGERTVASTPSFRSGGSRSLKARLAPGSYDYVCTVADHEELGMVGTLELR